MFILWSRLGTPLGLPPKADGTPYRSGTECEFDFILAARKRSNGERPHILVYTRRDDESWNATLDARKSDSVLKDLPNSTCLLRRIPVKRLREADEKLYGHDTLAEYAAWAAKIMHEKLHLGSEALEALTFVLERTPPGKQKDLLELKVNLARP